MPAAADRTLTSCAALAAGQPGVLARADGTQPSHRRCCRLTSTCALGASARDFMRRRTSSARPASGWATTTAWSLAWQQCAGPAGARRQNPPVTTQPLRGLRAGACGVCQPLSLTSAPWRRNTQFLLFAVSASSLCAWHSPKGEPCFSSACLPHWSAPAPVRAASCQAQMQLGQALGVWLLDACLQVPLDSPLATCGITTASERDSKRCPQQPVCGLLHRQRA